MWWKLGALALLAVGFIGLMVMAPATTVDIAVEMPRANEPLGPIDVEDFAFAATLIVYGFMAAVIALIGWMMWLVVRHHRSLKRRP